MRPPHPLWGAILDSIDIDVLQQRVIMNLHVVDESTAPSGRRHVLELGDVSDLRWFNSIPGPWAYAEITEIHASKSPAGALLVEIMLWSEDAGISLTAQSIQLDGKDAERYLTDRAYAWSCNPEP